jgi:hypothetical protein
MPFLIQVASNAVAGSSLTVTLASPTTAGNTLVALIGNSANTANGMPSGLTLGGSADNWAQAAIQGNSSDHAIAAGWVDSDCAGRQTSVVIPVTGGTGDLVMAWVFEWSGLTGTVDVSLGGANGSSASWTSGTTASTAQASEVAFGITAGALTSGTAPGLTGPSSPWVNESAQQLTGTSHTKVSVCGYQILTSTGTQVYAGTTSGTTTNDTLIFTLLASSSPPPANASLLLGAYI